MQNTLLDLNNHLFAQLERLGDEDLSGEKLEEEVIRAKAVASISTQVINNGNLVLKAKEMQNSYTNRNRDEKLPPMLTGEKE